MIGDLAVGEDGVAREDGTHVVAMGEVLRREDRTHPRRSRDGGGVDRQDAGVGASGEVQGGVEQPGRLGEVVDVARLARHVLHGAVVGHRLMQGGRAHASTSAFRGAVSRSDLRSRFRATNRR